MAIAKFKDIKSHYYSIMSALPHTWLLNLSSTIFITKKLKFGQSASSCFNVWWVKLLTTENTWAKFIKPWKNSEFHLVNKSAIDAEKLSAGVWNLCPKKGHLPLNLLISSPKKSLISRSFLFLTKTEKKPPVSTPMETPSNLQIYWQNEKFK